MKNLLLATTLVLFCSEAFASDVPACNGVDLKKLEKDLEEIVASGDDEVGKFNRTIIGKAKPCAKKLNEMYEKNETLDAQEQQIAEYVYSISHPFGKKKAK